MDEPRLSSGAGADKLRFNFCISSIPICSTLTFSSIGFHVCSFSGAGGKINLSLKMRTDPVVPEGMP